MSEVGRTQWKEACTEASKKKARLGNELGELVNAAVFDEEGVGKNATRDHTRVSTHTCQPCGAGDGNLLDTGTW